MYSVIIPAKNESENIARCIHSVFNSVKDRRLVEIVVVDNDSSDNTIEIARKEGAKVLINKDANLSGLRNFGAKNASFDIIGFIDADCEALPGWLKNARNILSDQTIGVVGDYCRLPKQPNWIENVYFSSLLRKKREVSYLGGANMVLRKEIFLNVHGFDEKTITGEDYVLCLKLKNAGFRIISDPSVSVIHHGNPKTLRQLFKKEIWRGLGMFDLYKYGKLTLPLIWSLFNIVLMICILVTLILGHLGFTLFLVILMLLSPGGAALVRSWRNNSYHYLLPLYIIFMIYGFGRTVSIFKLVIIELRKKLIRF